MHIIQNGNRPRTSRRVFSTQGTFGNPFTMSSENMQQTLPQFSNSHRNLTLLSGVMSRRRRPTHIPHPPSPLQYLSSDSHHPILGLHNTHLNPHPLMLIPPLTWHPRHHISPTHPEHPQRRQEVPQPNHHCTQISHHPGYQTAFIKSMPHLRWLRGRSFPANTGFTTGHLTLQVRVYARQFNTASKMW